MLAQHAVGQHAVSQQFDGAVEVALQPLLGDTCVGVVVQGLVDARHRLDLLQDGADVVADQDDGALAVNLLQQLVEARLEALVDIGAGLVEDDHLGVGHHGPSQQGTLQLSAAQLADGSTLQPVQSHACHDPARLFALLAGETLEEALLAVEPRQHHLFYRDGELAVDAGVLGQVAHADFVCPGACRPGQNLAPGGLHQSEDALDERRLAASVGADDAQEVALVDGQVDVVQHALAVVGSAQVLYFDDWVSHGCQRSAVNS